MHEPGKKTRRIFDGNVGVLWARAEWTVTVRGELVCTGTAMGVDQETFVPVVGRTRRILSPA